MTAKKYAFIWDLDGTLADSYPAIVPAVRDCLAAQGLELSEREIYAGVIATAAGTFLAQTAARYGLDEARLKSEFAALNDSRIEAIAAMPHAAETLETLERAGCRHFLFTHRGASCRPILERIGLLPFFTELVTALEGFPRKPEPDAIRYLLGKYALEPETCFYVGDRRIDVEAAVNAGIGSILFLPPGSPGAPTGRESLLVRDLREIPAQILP